MLRALLHASRTLVGAAGGGCRCKRRRAPRTTSESLSYGGGLLCLRLLLCGCSCLLRSATSASSTSSTTRSSTLGSWLPLLALRLLCLLSGLSPLLLLLSRGGSG